MGIITVEGLGQVEIAGDAPTHEEGRLILAQLESVAPAITPAIEEALSPLAGLQERFQQIEDPREETGPLGQAARGIGYGASRVARGALLGTGLAAAEATLGREEVERSPSFALHEEWKALEEGLYKPSVSFDDVLESGWDPSTVAAFIGESGVSSLPGMAAAVASMPRYAMSMVGEIAQQRAANRGPGAEVTGADLAVAAVTSGAVAGGERLGAKLAMGGGTAATPLRRVGQAAAGELVTEAGQEAVQTIGEQAFTREGEGLVAGVDPTEMAKRMAAGALVGGPMGGVIGAGAEGVRGLRRPPAEPPAWVETEAGAYDADERVERRLEPTPVTEEVVAEVEVPAFDPEASLEEYRLALDGRDPNPAEDIRAIEAILQRPGAGPWLGNMRNMALGRLEGDPFSERLRYGANRAEELWEQRRAAPTAEVVTEEVVTPTEEVARDPATEEALMQAEGLIAEIEGIQVHEGPIGALREIKYQVRLVDIEMAELRQVDEAWPEREDALETLRGALVERADNILQGIASEGDAALITQSREVMGPEATPDFGRGGTPSQVWKWSSYEGREADVAAAKARTPSKTDPYEAVRRAQALAAQDAPPIDAVDAIIESIDESTVPGEFTQAGPMALPLGAGPEVEAVDVMMETVPLIEGIERLKTKMKAEAKAAKRAVPKRPGTKAAERKPTRAENRVAEAEGRARAALAAADVAAADADIDDALSDAVAAQARVMAGPADFISAKNADVESLLRDMGRSDEDIRALSETQRVSYAQSLAMLEESNLRSSLEGEGQSLEVVIPPAMTALANSITQRPRAASDLEQLAFNSVIAQVNTANRRLSARINELDQIVPESSVERSAIQDEIDILTKKKEGLDADFDLFAAANKVIGSIWGRAGWMRQRRINDNMTLDEAQGAARAKRGAQLTPKQKELLKSIFNDADALRDAATKARKSALGDYNKAKRALERAQGVKKSADDVRKAARKRVEKAMDKRSPRQRAAEEEIRWGVDRPIRVTPLRMSAEEKAARKAFRDAQRKAKRAAKEVTKKEKEAQEIKGMVAQAEADIRRAKQKKAAAPEEAIQHPFFRHWTRQKSIARAMTSSGDDSALGRQGGALVLQNLGAAIRTLPYIVRVNPFKWDPVARRIVHNPASRAAAIEIQEEMLNSPWQIARNWAALEMSEVEGRSNTGKSGLDAKEEYFATHAFDEGGKLLQGVGKHLITPSQNLFGLTLNRLRSVNFDDGLRILAEGEGADLDAVTPEAGDAVITAMIEANAPPSKPRRLREGDQDLFLAKEDIPSLTPDERAEFGRIDLAMNVVPRADAEALAVIINASSGRGEWTFGVSDRQGVDVINKVLRNILFAPKFTASRFESFSHPFQLIAASRGHGRFKNVSPKALRLFRKRVGRSIGLGVGLGAMSVIAASFDDDRDPGEALDNFMNPGSADFLKGRIGTHRFDALGGIPTSVRYLLPLNFTPIEAWRKSDDPAEWAYHTLISDWGEGAGDKFSRMVRNKLDPLTSAAWTIFTQKDYLGRPLREQDFMGMPASEMNDVESFIINGLIRPIVGAYTPIMAQSASEAAIRTMYPHIGEEERNAFVHQFAPPLWEVLGGGHADYPDVKGSRGYRATPRRARKPRRPSPRRYSR